MKGYWDKACPVRTDKSDVPATVYLKGDKALVVIANWTDLPQTVRISVDEKLLGFKPSSITLPEVRNIQWGNRLSALGTHEIMAAAG